MSKSSINPFKRIKDLEARICCILAEACTLAVYTSISNAPVVVGVGLTYTVTVTIKGIDIVTTFAAGTLRAAILSGLNAKFLNFKAVFTVDGNSKLRMTVTDNLEGCDLTFTAVEA